MHSLHSRIERTVDALKEAYILALQLIHPSREYLYDRELTGLLHVLAEASGVDAQTIQDFCEGEAKRRRSVLAAHTTMLKIDDFYKVSKDGTVIEVNDRPDLSGYSEHVIVPCPSND